MSSNSLPTCSIICTVKNGGQVLEQTLTSILQQSYTDWEMIIVDDGSNDGGWTRSLLERYQFQDPRIRYISTIGIGRGRALNLAIAEARGVYIANVDADDPSHPDRLRLQVDAMMSRPEFAMICTETVHVHGTAEPEWEEIRIGEEELEVVDISRKLMRNNPVNHSSVLMRRAQLASIGNYATDRQTHFDYDLWARMIESSLRIGQLPLKLAAKRIHSGQSFENRSRIRYLMNSLKVQRRAIEALRGSLRAKLLMYLRFVYGLFPQQWRIRAKSSAWLAKRRSSHG